jgi:tRNA nucleotidyltransferase (CCA-adding enzyme)
MVEPNETDAGECFPHAATAEEWMRWAEACPAPGRLLAWLSQTGRLEEYPELAALIDVPQDEQWHPEGPVDTHTGFVLEAAGQIADREALQGSERAILLFAALTHDLGKPATTRQRLKRGELRWTAYGHDQEGVPIAARLLRRIGIAEEIVARVLPLVERHMAFRDFTGNETGAKVIRRMALRLAPATVRQLGYLIEADYSGRPPLPQGLPPNARQMLALAERHGVLDGCEPDPE